MYKTHAINELSFPKTAHEIQARRTPDHVVYGGAARSALLEAQSTPLIPIRDIDEIPVNQVDGQSFFTKIGDFSIDQALVLGNGELTLYITDQAQEAAAQRCIEPTDDRINAAHKLEELHKADPEDVARYKRFHRIRTDLAARALYLAAIAQASGVEMSVNMKNHPLPQQLSEVHQFYLGLRIRKSLYADEKARGPYNTTATSHMLDKFAEHGLMRPLPNTEIESIVHFCESVNEQHPQLHFFGSAIARLVRHSSQEPYEKIV